MPPMATFLFYGRGDRNRTCDPLHPMQVLYQAELRPDVRQHDNINFHNLQTDKLNHHFTFILFRNTRIKKPPKRFSLYQCRQQYRRCNYPIACMRTMVMMVVIMVMRNNNRRRWRVMMHYMMPTVPRRTMRMCHEWTWRMMPATPIRCRVRRPNTQRRHNRHRCKE